MHLVHYILLLAIAVGVAVAFVQVQIMLHVLNVGHLFVADVTAVAYFELALLVV